MVDRIVIVDGTLRDAIADIKASRSAFTAASNTSDALAEAVGHSRLSSAVSAFGNDWRLRREKLSQSLLTIEQQLQGALDKFGEWDDPNKHGLNPGAVPTPAPGPSTPPDGGAGSGSGTGSGAAGMPAAPEAGSDTGGDPGAGTVTSPLPPEPATDPQEPLPDTPEPDPETDPATTPSAEAVDALLDVLEGVIDSPGGMVALGGAIGGLLALLAVLNAGGPAAEALSSVDRARIEALVAKWEASQPAPPTTPPLPAPPDIDDLFPTDPTPDGAGAEGEAGTEPPEADGDAETEEEPEAGTDADADTDDSDTPPADQAGEPVSDKDETDRPDPTQDDMGDLPPMPAAPGAPDAAGAAGASSWGAGEAAGMPSMPDLPGGPVDGTGADRSGKFEELFGNDAAVTHTAQTVSGPGEVNAALDAMGGNSTEQGATARPMAMGSMGSMAAMGSAAAMQATSPVGGGSASGGAAVKAGNEQDQIEEARRLLDELRDDDEEAR